MGPKQKMLSLFWYLRGEADWDEADMLAADQIRQMREEPGNELSDEEIATEILDRYCDHAEEIVRRHQPPQHELN